MLTNCDLSLCIPLDFLYIPSMFLQLSTPSTPGKPSIAFIQRSPRPDASYNHASHDMPNTPPGRNKSHPSKTIEQIGIEDQNQSQTGVLNARFDGYGTPVNTGQTKKST